MDSWPLHQIAIRAKGAAVSTSGPTGARAACVSLAHLALSLEGLQFYVLESWGGSLRGHTPTKLEGGGL